MLIALVALCVLAGGGCGSKGDDAVSPATTPVAGRVLIIGLDGADWEILDRLEADGGIPNLSRLRREGAHGVLRAERPLLSPVLWTSIATGRPPTEHGIYGFLTRRNGVDEPVRSDERKVRAFWNVATDLGVSVGVVGWYSSWPAEHVNGFLISDRVGSHQVSGSAGGVTSQRTYPPELILEVEKLQPEVDAELERIIDGFFDGTPLDSPGSGDERMETFRGILRTTELYRRLTPRLLSRFAPEIAAVYFEGTDAVGHLFAEFESPRLPWVTPEQQSAYGETFARYYRYVDTIVGELLAEVDPARTTVIVVSDHGFKSGARRPGAPSTTADGNQAPLWHRPEGILMLWGRGIRPGVQLPEAGVYDVVPTAFRAAGLPIALNLRGRPVDAAFSAELLQEPVRSVPDYEAAGQRELVSAVDSAADEQMAKLRALGYVGGSSGADAEAPLAGAAEGQAAIPLNRFNEAMIQLNAGRIEQARATSRALQGEAPQSPMGFLGEGIVLLRQGNGPAAVDPLRAATRLNPRLARAQAHLGEALMLSGRPGDAGDSFERALELDPVQGRPALLLAQLRLGERRLDEAARWFEVSRRSSDEDSDRARACVGLAILAEERRSMSEAARFYGEALELAPDFPPALERFANLSLYTNDAARAVELLERLLVQRPDSAAAHTAHRRALALLGRPAEAQ